MTCGITCGLNSGWFLTLQQCMKNTIVRNKKTPSFRELCTFTKGSGAIFLVKLPRHTIKNSTVGKVQWKSDAFLRRQCLVPLGCNLYSNNGNKIEEKEKEKKSEVKLSLYQRLKLMYKQYWYVLVPVHLITSTFWFGSFYYLAASGIDIPVLLESLGAPEAWVHKLKNSKAGNFILAYTLYKVAAPLRYTVTLGGTTISINYLKKWGWIKPVPNKEKIKKIYEEQKGAFKDLKASYQDKMQVTKNEFLKTKREMKQQYSEAKEIFHNSMSNVRHDIDEGFKSGVDEMKTLGRSCTREMKKGWRGLSNKEK